MAPKGAGLRWLVWERRPFLRSEMETALAHASQSTKNGFNPGADDQAPSPLTWSCDSDEKVMSILEGVSRHQWSRNLADVRRRRHKGL